MFCSKCGSDVSDELNFCPICSAPLSALKENDTTDALFVNKRGAEIYTAARQMLSKNNARKILKMCAKAVLWILAVTVLITALVGASKFESGQKLISNMAVYGYASDGNQLWLYICSGFAYLTRAVGVFFAAALAWMGFKL